MDDQSRTCRSKKGFFFLRDCKAPATGECEECGRPVCEDHMKIQSTRTICSECFVNVSPRKNWNECEKIEDHRNEWYSRHHYSPFYSGRHLYFSDNDFQTFNNTSIADSPTKAEKAAWMKITREKDTHVLAGAIKGKAEVLISLDPRHVLKPSVQEAFPIPIMSPGDFLQKHGLVAPLPPDHQPGKKVWAHSRKS